MSEHDDPAVVALSAKILPLLLRRWPMAEGKISLHACCFRCEPPTKYTCQKWNWLLWVDTLPYRIGSWQSVEELLAAKTLVLVNEGDRGGTPGFGDVRPQYVTVGTAAHTPSSALCAVAVRSRTRTVALCRSRTRSSP